jgi:hypothetical protein
VQEQAEDVSLDVLFAMIAQLHLNVDLDAMPLIEHEAVRLYLNRAMAEAHTLLLASSVRASAHETASLSRHMTHSLKNVCGPSSQLDCSRIALAVLSFEKFMIEKLYFEALLG